MIVEGIAVILNTLQLQDWPLFLKVERRDLQNNKQSIASFTDQSVWLASKTMINHHHTLLINVRELTIKFHSLI